MDVGILVQLVQLLQSLQFVQSVLLPLAESLTEDWLLPIMQIAWLYLCKDCVGRGLLRTTVSGSQEDEEGR